MPWFPGTISSLLLFDPKQDIHITRKNQTMMFGCNLSVVASSQIFRHRSFVSFVQNKFKNKFKLFDQIDAWEVARYLKGVIKLIGKITKENNSAPSVLNVCGRRFNYVWSVAIDGCNLIDVASLSIFRHLRVEHIIFDFDDDRSICQHWIGKPFKRFHLSFNQITSNYQHLIVHSFINCSSNCATRASEQLANKQVTIHSCTSYPDML